MELLVCAIVLVLVGSHTVSTTPHGYGVKTGAAAQAVAGASAGAFGGAAGLPIAVPHGAGFSGSYSKSASSSFASSSASSSSSSFSFSGSGIPGPAGGCTSGLCPNADNNGRVPNGNTNGYYSNNGANALAGAQAGAFAGSQAFNKDGATPLCSGSNCPNQNGADCKGSTCNGVSPNGNKCENGKCGSQSPESSTYDKEPNEKCTSAQCNTGSESKEQDNPANSNNNLNSEDGNICTSGNCETTSPNDVSPSTSYPTNNCASGQCGPSSGPGKPNPHGGNSYPNKPAEKCTSGQCAPSFNNGSPSDYDDNSKLNNPNSSKCTSGQCETSAGDNFPPNYDSTNEKCKSGQCKPLANGVPTSPEQQNSYDIPVNIPSTASVKPSVGFGPTAQSSPGCLSGNCGTFPASKPTPSYTHGSTNTYPRPTYSNQKPIGCDSPDCNNGAYNPHASSPSDASLPAYNKPVTYLTAPKQEPSCTSPNCQSASTIPGYYPSGSITPISGAYPTIPSNTKKPTCSNGNCSPTQPPNPNSYSVPLIPNQSNYGYKPSGPICTTGNCDSTPQTGFGTTQNVPYSSSFNSPNVPHGSIKPTAPSHGYSTSFNPSSYEPNNHLSTQSVPQHSLSNFKPTQPQNPAAFPSFSTQPTLSPTAAGPNYPKDDDSIPPFMPLTPPKSSNCAAYPCPGNSVTTYPSIPTGHPLSPAGSNYPGTYNTGVPSAGEKKPEMPYHGGFGAPSGLLKPNDFTLPSIQLTTSTKPTAASDGDHTIPCISGNCNSQPQYGQGSAGATAGKPLGTHSPASCSTGKCGPPNGQTGAFNLNGANSAASAVASATADAVAYSGGFGGPPGLLKPFDHGKLTSKSNTGSAELNSGHYPTSGDHNTAGNGALSGAAAHTAAAAGATAGAFGGAPYHHGANDGHGTSGGCGGGCDGSYPKGGYGAISGAGAAAKSISFGSSFASAHASSGAATKGGYGR